jgi:hypothetical protein
MSHPANDIIPGPLSRRRLLKLGLLSAGADSTAGAPAQDFVHVDVGRVRFW